MVHQIHKALANTIDTGRINFSPIITTGMECGTGRSANHAMVHVTEPIAEIYQVSLIGKMMDSRTDQIVDGSMEYVATPKQHTYEMEKGKGQILEYNVNLAVNLYYTIGPRGVQLVN